VSRAAVAAAIFVGAVLTAGAGLPPAGVDVARLLADDAAPVLADYHLFADAGARRPNGERVIPYDLQTPLFSDYALKERYVFLPPGTKVRYAAAGALDFPVGATLIKTFAFPADLRQPGEKVRFIETRLLIHRQAGWVPLTYVWNEAQDQAVLKRAGTRVPVAFVDAAGRERRIDYQIPNVNQCKQCHELAGATTPIGPKARNLDRDGQLERWSRVGLLQGAPPAGTAPRLPRWDDPDAPVDGRARAYLDVNCGHCHNPAGTANNSGLTLTWEETEPAALGVGKRPVAAGRGSGNLEVAIDPGHPDRSILIYRMASTEPGVLMPQIGRSVVHDEGLALVRAYIAAMKPAGPAKAKP
jgi:uncharacterized repeat protein (TIGR03806 family)